MAADPTHSTDARAEHDAPAGTGAPSLDASRGPFTLASLLDLNDEDLAEPLSRVAPPEHRWEQLSLGVAEDGDSGAIPAALRTGVASQPPATETELIPGLDAPGAVEVPVYLAGRTLTDFLRNTPVSAEAIASAPDDAPVATGTFDAPPAMEAVDDVGTAPRTAVPSPARPPAITVTDVRPPRRRPEPPVANFGQTTDVPVLWPRRKPVTSPAAVPQICAKCGAPSDGQQCAACGYDTTVPAPRDAADTWGHFTAAFLDSDSRALRTIGALVLAPGELTASWIAGHRRRYFGPVAVSIAALLLFAVISALGGLRPRPDRALMIGTDRTIEALPGLVDARPVNLAVDAPPDLIRDVANTMDYVPILWLPLMACGVIAVVVAFRAFQRSDDHADVVFAAHFTAWFVLWWGLAVPLLLLALKFGFEYSAAWDGVDRVRYGRNGQIDGLSPLWHALRAAVVSPAFHTWLVGLGLAPWAVWACRRAFDSSWVRAGIGAVLVTAVPLFLLAPFA